MGVSAAFHFANSFVADSLKAVNSGWLKMVVLMSDARTRSADASSPGRPVEPGTVLSGEVSLRRLWRGSHPERGADGLRDLRGLQAGLAERLGGLELRGFQFDTLAQQFRPGLVVGIEARSDQLSAVWVVKPDPPGLSSQVLCSHGCFPPSTMRSMSSEKRSMSFHAFERDVPPVKARWFPMPGMAKSSLSVQQTQKSLFHTLGLEANGRLEFVAGAPAFLGRQLEKGIHNQRAGASLATRRKMSPIHAGAHPASAGNAARSCGDKFRRSLATVSSSTKRRPIHRSARMTCALLGFFVETNRGETCLKTISLLPCRMRRLGPVVSNQGRMGI